MLLLKQSSMKLLLLLVSVPGLLTSQCGQAKEQLQPGRERYQGDKTSLDRVVDGQTATPNSIPWQAWLVTWTRVTKGKTLLGFLVELIAFGAGFTSIGQCGGILISNYYAHCVANMCCDGVEIDFKGFLDFFDFYFIYFLTHDRDLKVTCLKNALFFILGHTNKAMQC